MAKMYRNKADFAKVKKVLGKKTKYSSLTTSEREIILEELLKTTNGFCPFTGSMYPKDRNWTIEHFYHCQARFPEKQCDWNNFIHCVGDANQNFDPQLDYPNVYSPEDVDYVEVLIYNLLTGEILPKKINDQKAKNTIERFKLNQKAKCDCRKDWFEDKNKYQNEPFPFCEYFS